MIVDILISIGLMLFTLAVLGLLTDSDIPQQ